MLDYISLRGCRLHNLKNVDAQFPRGKITVVCGPSGCGKSTLVMDTLHGESKRRYLETLSPFAADLLGGKRTIPLDSAEGLPASLAIAATRGQRRRTPGKFSNCGHAWRSTRKSISSLNCRMRQRIANIIRCVCKARLPHLRSPNGEPKPRRDHPRNCRNANRDKATVFGENRNGKCGNGDPVPIRGS